MQSFEGLNLSQEVAKAIAQLGYTAPSPIQAATLPVLLAEPTDFIGQAATGTGKTAAFGIPLVERIQPHVRGVQGLVLCPTRELATQVADQLSQLGKFKNVQTIAIYGGSAYDPQIRGLREGKSIVVGTPGRVLDHLRRGTLKLKDVHTVVLDEADEMISMGFREDLETILQDVDRERANTWLFSATMSPSVRQVAEQYLNEPQKVSINRDEVLSASVEQIYYWTHEKNKAEILCKIIDSSEEFYGLVFCQTKILVTDLTKFMQSKGFQVDCLHGDMSQAARESTMQAFRSKRVKVLICTDVASRGLDVKDVTHVVNYSLPRETEVYVHRIGRTARAGQSGVAISLVTPSHRSLIGRIEHITRSRMVEGRIPGRREVALKKVAQLLPKFTEEKWHARAIESMNDEWKQALSGLDGQEIAARFMCMIFGDLFSERDKSQDVFAAECGSFSSSQTLDDGAPRRGRGRSNDRRAPARGRDREYGRERGGPRRERDGMGFGGDRAAHFSGKPRRDKKFPGRRDQRH